MGQTSPNSKEIMLKRIFSRNYRSEIDIESKNTEDRYKPVVRVDRLNLLSSRKESENNQYTNNNNSNEIPF